MSVCTYTWLLECHRFCLGIWVELFVRGLHMY